MKPHLATLDLPSGWCTYMLICIDGSYYLGLTNDLSQHFQDHSSSKGPTYTRTPKRESAAAREKQLKGWTRTKKHALARAELQLGPTAQRVCLSLR
jgi:predicted GIY-YIG superfamily endonuclease